MTEQEKDDKILALEHQVKLLWGFLLNLTCLEQVGDTLYCEVHKLGVEPLLPHYIVERRAKARASQEGQNAKDI